MPRYAYQSHFVDGNGTIVPNGTVTVYLSGTDTLATIYESSTGASTSSSQLTTDSNDGSFKFYVDTDDYASDQSFRITLSKTNFRTQTYDDILIFPPIWSSETTGGTGSAGSGKQYVELTINGTTYKILHDGTV